MEEVGSSYQEQLTGVVTSSAPKIPFYSSVTASRIGDANALGPAYWRANLESPVLFNSALRVLRAELQGRISFAEIGPHPALKGPLQQILRDIGQADDFHLSTLHRGADCQQSLLSLAGKLFLKNYPLDLGEISPPGTILTDLPNYAWLHDIKHWDESRLTNEWRFRSQTPHELLGTRILEVSSELHWRNKFGIDNLPWLTGHQVSGSIVFPAAGYITIVGEALRQLSGVKDYSLRHVKISSALTLEHNEEVEMVTSLNPLLTESPEDSPWYTFHISSYNGVGWVKHCSGEGRASFDEISYPRSVDEARPLPRKVSSNSWYEAMNAVGFCYDGLFRGLHSISAGTSHNEAVATVPSPTKQECLPYTLHPAMIDQCFQLLALASIQGQTRKLDRLSVPTFIDEIVILSSGANLQVKASGSVSAKGGFTGSLTAQHNGEVSMFMKGLKSTPLDTGEPVDQGLRLVQQIEWKPDSDFMQLENCFKLKEREKEEFLQLESLFMLCIVDHLENITLNDDTPPYLRKYFEWMQTQVALVQSGERNLVEKAQVLCESSQRQEKIKSTAAAIEKTGVADCAVAILRLFEAAGAIFAAKAQPLDILMEGNLLSRLYDILDSGDYVTAINAIGYKNPRLSILEIGAGTGGTSAKILEALKSPFGERMYSKYTYTDISPGFMNAAKERFHQYENIEYRVLDISKDPAEQGFDLGAYDLIIGANVVHATPSLNTSLTHLRSLLQPGGRLFLQELSPETKWVNYIWGYLSGWWLGSEDGRPDEPYVSPSRWSQELICAGFDTPDTIVYDGLAPCHLNANIIASASSDDAKEKRLTILCMDLEEPHVRAMKLRLETKSVAVDICLLNQTPPPDQDIIALLDFPDPILHSMSKEVFETIFRHVLAMKSKIFWVTQAAQINSKDPRHAMILGIARTARNEQAAKLYTIELDGKTESTTVADRIAAIVSRVNKKSAQDDAVIVDWEYAIVDGQVNVPRMHWQTMPESMAQCDVQPKSTTQHLTVGTPGLLHTMQWTEEALPELRDGEVCIQIKSVGMNFKVGTPEFKIKKSYN
jgi:acyl transferase domain-containing protein